MKDKEYILYRYGEALTELRQAQQNFDYASEDFKDYAAEDLEYATKKVGRWHELYKKYAEGLH